jgi:hypothetical protein
MEIAVSVYEKMRTNSKGNFFNKKLFTENGGHISKKQREQFNFIHTNNATFQQYFLKYYKKPVTSFSALTIKHCDYIIRYEKLQKDYLEVLKKLGIKDLKKIPVENKTKDKKKDMLLYYTKDIQKRAVYVFGPFFKKYNYNFPESWEAPRISLKGIIYFKIISFLKELNEKFFKKKLNQKSIKGSIYGDMQRE